MVAVGVADSGGLAAGVLAVDGAINPASAIVDDLVLVTTVVVVMADNCACAGVLAIFWAAVGVEAVLGVIAAVELGA